MQMLERSCRLQPPGSRCWDHFILQPRLASWRKREHMGRLAPLCWVSIPAEAWVSWESPSASCLPVDFILISQMRKQIRKKCLQGEDTDAALKWGRTNPAGGGPQHSAWLMHPGQKLPFSAWPRKGEEGQWGAGVNPPPPRCPDEVVCCFFLKDWLSAPHPPWSLTQVLEECPPTSIWDRASGHRVWAGLPLH